MVRIQQRISVGLEVLQFFAMRQWSFRDDNYRGLMQFLKGTDAET